MHKKSTLVTALLTFVCVSHSADVEERNKRKELHVSLISFGEIEISREIFMELMGIML